MALEDSSHEDTYKKIKKIGEGAHGVVWLAAVVPSLEDEHQPKKRMVDASSSASSTSTPSSSPAPSPAPSPTPVVIASAQPQSTAEDEMQLVALKKIRVKDYKYGLSLDAIREIKLLQELNHPNVIKV